MKNYNKCLESIFLMYLDANNLHGWGMSQKLPVNAFKWVTKLSKFDKDFIKNYDENSSKGYIPEVDVEYPKNILKRQSDLPFLPTRKKTEKCNKLACNIHDKENYVVDIKAVKQALNHGLISKKVHKVIRFNQKAWLKPYNDINNELRTDAKNDFFKLKDFFKLRNNTVFGKTMENVRKQRDIKLVTTHKRRNQLASESNYHATKYFSENLLALEIKKTKVKLNKLVYLGMSIVDISKTLMYEFWHDYIKPKFQD